MEPISNITSNAAQFHSNISGVKELPKAQTANNSIEGLPQKSIKDRFVPEEEQEPIGLYWLGKDENGNPKIYFDDPTQDSKSLKNDLNKTADSKQESQKSESWTCNTDKVDLEIKQLKRKFQKLDQQLETETDASKIKKLEAKLKQVEAELNQKDNDTYRRQHATFSRTNS